MTGVAPRHFLDIADHPSALLRRLLDDAAGFKRLQQQTGRQRRTGLLRGKTLALMFEKPSTRTRVSFEVAMRQLGGDVIVLSGQEMQRGRGESIADTARVLSRYVDAIMLRTADAAELQGLARYASVPVINGLTQQSHPCQIMADVMTFEERFGTIAGQVVAWVGDGNNVACSWIEAAARFGFTLRLATPADLRPRQAVLDWARGQGADIRLGEAPEDAVGGARCVVTDTWISMGDVAPQTRPRLLSSYRVDAALMDRAAPDAIFMHCLPAHRGEEVTAEVIDGPRSVVFDEAENRLHVQKSILNWALG